MSIERIGPGGPLVLRVKHEAGIVSYWNWDTVSRFQWDTEIGGFFFKDGTFHKLSKGESRQVAAQLDSLIDPPMLTVKEANEMMDGKGLWRGHPFIAKDNDE